MPILLKQQDTCTHMYSTVTRQTFLLTCIHSGLWRGLQECLPVLCAGSLACISPRHATIVPTSAVPPIYQQNRTQTHRNWYLLDDEEKASNAQYMYTVRTYARGKEHNSILFWYYIYLDTIALRDRPWPTCWCWGEHAYTVI